MKVCTNPPEDQRQMRFRNSILAFGGKNAPSQLMAIDEQVSEYSAILTQKRYEFLNSLVHYTNV